MRFRCKTTLSAVLLVLGTAALCAQASSDSSPSSAEYDALLAKASKLYYSAVRPGPAHGTLESFQCTIQPEWPTLLAAIDKATGRSTSSDAVGSNDPRLALLTPIAITEHVDITGRSTLDWNQPSSSEQSANPGSTEMLDRAHQTVEHALEGFFQFWTPFVNGTIIPSSSKGIEVERNDAGYSVRAALRDQKLNEVFSPDLTLKEFNVSMGGIGIRFMPTFDSTPEGLLVKAFDAHIQLPGTPAPPERRMQVAMDYQTVQGYQLPSHLALDVTGIGRAAFVFSGCTVQPAAK